MNYQSLSPAELIKEKEKAEGDYRMYCESGLSLDLSRGKPAADQLALAMPMLTEHTDEFRSAGGSSFPRSPGSPPPISLPAAMPV